MATTAHAAPNQATVPDDVMDLSSDSGHDFDGDIELDIDLAPHEDDDVSIKDAFTDPEIADYPTTTDPNGFTADPDDFMADSDDEGIIDVRHQGLFASSHTAVGQTQEPAHADDVDLIDYGADDADEGPYGNQAYQDPLPSSNTAVTQEQAPTQPANDEDLIDYGADEVEDGQEAHQEPASSNHTTVTQEQAPAPANDDDLIDYSDEEDDDQPPPEPVSSKAHTPVSTNGNGAHMYGDHVHHEEEAVAQDANDEEHHYKDDATYETNYQEHHNSDDAVHETKDLEQQTEYGAVYETNDQESPNAYDAVTGANDQERHDGDESQADDEGDNHTEGEDGGVVLEDPETQTNLSEQQPDSFEDQRSIETRPITVNYEGNELWLFKQHDTEDSGDWLIDDISLVHSSLSDLFQACRASLGEDLSNETELGLRFDHLHNMELFEDSTACVAVSLERLVDLYITLHAQDGESDPESFYMCLLSRPRFASLLSDVVKHAEQGSGYSGLNSAVAAGETHFADVYSGHSTEHDGTDWDNDVGVDATEEEQQQQNEGTETPSEAEPEVEHVEQEDQHGIEIGVNVNTDTKEAAGTDPDDTPTSEDVTRLDQDSRDAEDPKSANTAEGGEGFAQPEVTDEGTQQATQALSSEQEEQLANDTVDYSDQEDEDEPSGVDPDVASQSSATVQDNISVTGELPLQVAEPADPPMEEKEQEHNYGDDDVTDNNLIGDHAGETQVEEQFDHDDNTESYQDYAQVYDEDDPFQGFQIDAPEAYTAEHDQSGLTNQDHAAYEYQELDQQLQYDFTNGADFDDAAAGEATYIENDVSNGDDFLDLENAPEWSVDQEFQATAPEDTSVLHDVVSGQAEEEEDGAVEQPVVAASSAADPVAASSADLVRDSPQGTKRSIDEVGDSVGDALDFTGTSWATEFLIDVTGADIISPDMKRPRV
jgi:hypothetical protein